uniref:Uncharacterized protein n=1 Tax=Rhabditophanes sp. KR3021 TaxID=114890 RepID=A0AC35TFW9_9BILA
MINVEEERAHSLTSANESPSSVSIDPSSAASSASCSASSASCSASTTSSTPANNKQCTSYRLFPPMENPVDMAIGVDCIAIADYDNGVLFIDLEGHLRVHLETKPYRICGVGFRENNDFIVLLAYTDSKWSILIYNINDSEQIKAYECPSKPLIPSWALHRMIVLDDVVYLLATADHLSAIWSLNLKTEAWKTLLVQKEQDNGEYQGFDVRHKNENERQILLCQQTKAQLIILTISNKDELTETGKIKMKRKSSQKWIIQGPRFAAWDSDNDIVVFDAAGKMFWFNGESYKICKIISDIGRSEVCAVQAKDDWCYALCRNQLSIHAFLYR